MTFEMMISEFPQAPASCVPSLDHAILNNDPLFGFSRACDHWKKRDIILARASFTKSY